LLQKLKEKVTVGIVGGSDLCKILEQLGGDDGFYFYLYAYIRIQNKTPVLGSDWELKKTFWEFLVFWRFCLGFLVTQNRCYFWVQMHEYMFV
jgi:hypothetical protein